MSTPPARPEGTGQRFLIDGKLLEEAEALALFRHGRIDAHLLDARQRTALEMLGRLIPQGAVLDVGCYAGTFTEMARRRSPRLRVMGCDAVDDHIRLAKLLYPDHAADYIRCSVYGLAFPDASFDGVSFQAVIEHVDRPVDAVREIHRVLKPGGVVIVNTPNAASLAALAYGFLREVRGVGRRLRRRPSRMPHEIFFAESEWNRHIYAWTVPTLTTLFVVNGYEYVEHRLIGNDPVTRAIPGMGREILLAVRKSHPAPTGIV